MKRSLTFKIAIVIILMALTGGSVTAYLVYKNSTRALQTSTSNSQTEEARQTLDKIDRFLYERMVDMQSLSGRQQLQNFLALPAAQRSPAEASVLNNQLETFKNTTGVWAELTIVDSRGNQPLSSSLQNLQTELARQPSVIELYTQALSGQIGYSDALTVIKGHEPVMLFMVPVRQQLVDGHPIIGVIVGELAWQSNLDILTGLQVTHATLINKDGISLGDNQPDASKEVLLKNFSATQAFKNAQKYGSGAGVFPGIEDPKKSYLTAYTRENGYLDYHGNNWILILATPKSTAYASANHLAKTLILTFTIILALAAPALLIFLRILIIKPIRELENVTARLSSGDFSLRTTIKSRDELGRLSQDFNDMADKIQLANRNLSNSTSEAIDQKRVLQTILDNLPVGVMVVEAPGGKPIMMNKVGSQIIGRGPRDDANKNCYAETYDILKADGSPYPEHELPLPTTLRTGKASFKDDLFFRRPDGTQVPVRATDAPIRDDNGNVTSAVSVFEDISKERELERSREEFFSIASHELRTPLTAIMGNSSLIQQYYGAKLPDDDAREMVADIHESSVRLIEIVNDFLDTSRLEQKRMKYEIANFDILAVVNSVVKEYQVTGSRKKIHLEISQPPAPLPMIKADQNRTKQALINLVGNSMKFTESGTITISFKLEAKLLKVLVTDTGGGMSPEAQKQLFRKFEQTSSTIITRDSVRGTGLGLYISKLIIEQMGGKIKLESSQEGLGTTFSFSLPIA